MPITAKAEPPGPGKISDTGRLRAEIRSRPAGPYLVSVTSRAAPHCGAVTVTWGAPDGELTVTPVPHTWAKAEAAGYRQVSLLWPPAEPGGYILIVDGIGACGQAGDDPALTVTVTRAVLHRRAPAPEGSSSSCGSDCLSLIG